MIAAVREMVQDGDLPGPSYGRGCEGRSSFLSLTIFSRPFGTATLLGFIGVAAVGVKHDALFPGRVQNQRLWLGDQIPPEPRQSWTTLMISRPGSTSSGQALLKCRVFMLCSRLAG